MKRSLNEVQRICQKAAEGAGAPVGLDTDAAHGAVWLMARDLPALPNLVQDLTRFPDLSAACRFERGSFSDSNQVVDATDKAGAVIAPMLIDLLLARAAEDNETGRLQVNGLSAPLFLLPPAVRYAGEGWGFRLCLVDGVGQCFAFHMPGQGGPEILGPEGCREIAGVLEGGTDWTLYAVCNQSPDLLDDRSQTDHTVIMEAERLAAAAARSLAEGVSPEPGSWDRLQLLATKVLVPATEQSHRLGAGALASDNE